MFQQVVGYLYLIVSFVCVFGKYLKFLLFGSDFCVDVFDIQFGIDVQVEVFFDDFLAVSIVGVYGVVVRLLWLWIVIGREVQWFVGFQVLEEVFLFEVKLEVGIVIINCSLAIGWVRCVICIQYFVYYQEVCLVVGVWINCNGLE